MDQQNTFNGWAIVELFGHQKIAGHVTTEYFGQACMFRVDVPELPERETTLSHSTYAAGSTYVPRGSKVKQPLEAGYSRLIGPGAIYAINPATEETVRAFCDENRKMPLIPLDLAGAQKAIAAPDEDEDDDDEDYVPY
jgi:hypothetical protein